MGCPYCGGEIPPKAPGVKGRQRRFCSDQCQHNYYSMLNSRKRRGLSGKPEFCKTCGKVIMYHRHDYCSDYCMERGRVLLHHDYQIAGINKLRFAILKQAKQDGVLDRFMKKKHFYQLYPELTPDILGKGEPI